MLSNYLCQLKSRSSLRFSSNQQIVNNIIKNSWDLIHFPHHPSSVFHAAHTNIILFQSWIRLGVRKTLFKDSNQCKERIFMVTVSQLQRLLIMNNHILRYDSLNVITGTEKEDSNKKEFAYTNSLKQSRCFKTCQVPLQTIALLVAAWILPPSGQFHALPCTVYNSPEPE